MRLSSSFAAILLCAPLAVAALLPFKSLAQDRVQPFSLPEAQGYVGIRFLSLPEALRQHCAFEVTNPLVPPLHPLAQKAVSAFQSVVSHVLVAQELANRIDDPYGKTAGFQKEFGEPSIRAHLAKALLQLDRELAGLGRPMVADVSSGIDRCFNALREGGYLKIAVPDAVPKRR